MLSGSCRFVELHGDRAGLDDPAMVCGLASMDGISFMFIGHQKGRNTKVPCCSHPMACTSNWPGTWATRFLALGIAYIILHAVHVHSWACNCQVSMVDAVHRECSLSATEPWHLVTAAVEEC